jgi:hypothetical protein
MRTPIITVFQQVRVIIIHRNRDVAKYRKYVERYYCTRGDRKINDWRERERDGRERNRERTCCKPGDNRSGEQMNKQNARRT